MTSRFFVVLACIALFSSACTQDREAPASAPAATDSAEARGKDARRAKQIQLIGVNQPDIDLADLEGKVVVVDVWATWCAPCRRALPGLARLSQEKADQVAVIGLSVDQERKTLESFLTKQPLPYPVAHANGAASRAFPARVLPTLYVLDKEGEHVDTLVGELPEAALLSILSKYY